MPKPTVAVGVPAVVYPIENIRDFARRLPENMSVEFTYS